MTNKPWLYEILFQVVTLQIDTFETFLLSFETISVLYNL